MRWYCLESRTTSAATNIQCHLAHEIFHCLINTMHITVALYWYWSWMLLCTRITNRFQGVLWVSGHVTINLDIFHLLILSTGYNAHCVISRGFGVIFWTTKPIRYFKSRVENINSTFTVEVRKSRISTHWKHIGF